MHYIRIAIAVAVGVSLGLTLEKNGDKVWTKIKSILESIKSWWEVVWGFMIYFERWIFYILLIVGVVGGIGYLIYGFLKWVDWEGVLSLIVLYGSPLLLIPIFVRLGKISHPQKKQ